MFQMVHFGTLGRKNTSNSKNNVQLLFSIWCYRNPFSNQFSFFSLQTKKKPATRTRVTMVILLSLAINSLFNFFFPSWPKPLVVVLPSQTKRSIPSSSASPLPLQQIKFPYHRLPPNKEARQLCMALEVTFSPLPFFIYFFPSSLNLCTSLWLQCSHAVEKETKSHKAWKWKGCSRWYGMPS